MARIRNGDEIVDDNGTLIGVRNPDGSDTLFVTSQTDPVTGVIALSAGSAAVSAEINSRMPAQSREYPLGRYGDISQALTFATAAMTAGSAALSVTGYTFTSADIGKTVGVRGAGVIGVNYTTLANDGVLVGTISSVNAGTATLSVAATNTVSGAECVFGTPVDTALAAAIDAIRAGYAADSIPGTVVFPAGKFLAVSPQSISSGVSFRGAGRDATAVYVVKVVSDAGNATTAPWIKRAAAYATAGRYRNVNITDLTLVGSYFASSGAYGADMKMIHLAYTEDSRVQRIRIVDNPSTAIGYDESLNCLIADNIILNPGRLAESTSSHGSAGGSGIGVAVGSTGDLSMIIRNNFIKGRWTAAGGTGRSGINIEAASGIAAPPTYYGGVIIEGNIIEGFYNGIVDSGAIGTIVRGNLVRRCTHGIKAGTNGISVGRLPRDMSIVGNRVADCFAANGNYSIGIAATTASATADSQGRILIADNIVTGCVGGYGMHILGSATYPLRNTTIRNNHVFDSDLSGIRIFGNLFSLVVAGNQISASGRSNTAGNKAPIKIESTVVWQDGRLDGNTYTDYQTVPTQDASHSIHASAVLTNVTTVA